jgi:integrase
MKQQQERAEEAGSAPPPLRSFDIDRRAELWVAGEPARQGESVSRAISQFSPLNVVPEVWKRIEHLVTTSVEQAEPTSVYSAKSLMTVVTQLVVWVDSLGLPLEPHVVFHPDNIDRFASEGCARLASGTQHNYRTQLRAVGAAVIGSEYFPPPPLPLKRSAPLEPYSLEDIAALRAWCRGLPTERYRRNIEVILAFGLGAGLPSQELIRLVGTDVRRDDDGVSVTVIGARGREVPVLDDWAEEVAGLAQSAGEGPIFLPERAVITRRQIPNFIARCPKGDAPGLNVNRLRNTWIVTHLSAGTHLLALAEAAGVEPSQVVKLSHYASAPNAESARRMLRGPHR